MRHLSCKRCEALILVFSILLLLYTPNAFCQSKLDAFKADATPDNKPSSTSSGEDSDGFFAEMFAQSLGFLFEATLLYGGICSWERVTIAEEEDDPFARIPGEPLIPFLRTDLSWQSVKSDIQAADVRAETGYGPLGVHVNYTRYREEDPVDHLDVLRILGMYRMSFGSFVEVDLGFGALTLDNEDTTSQFLLSSPVLIHPGGLLGIEWRPAWSSNTTDHDLAVMCNWEYTSLKTGYRWLNSPNESLHGPYIGLSLRL